MGTPRLMPLRTTPQGGPKIEPTMAAGVAWNPFDIA
jgi:hypothetical protein